MEKKVLKLILICLLIQTIFPTVMGLKKRSGVGKLQKQADGESNKKGSVIQVFKTSLENVEKDIKLEQEVAHQLEVALQSIESYNKSEQLGNFQRDAQNEPMTVFGILTMAVLAAPMIETIVTSGVAITRSVFNLVSEMNSGGNAQNDDFMNDGPAQDNFSLESLSQINELKLEISKHFNDLVKHLEDKFDKGKKIQNVEYSPTAEEIQKAKDLINIPLMKTNLLLSENKKLAAKIRTAIEKL